MVAPHVKVLVVDPVAASSAAVTECLRRAGFLLIDQIQDAQVALEVIECGEYGLVICDMALRPASGLDLLKAVRADALTANLAFVLLAEDARIDVAINARRAGASAFMVKPISERLWMQTLDQIDEGSAPARWADRRVVEAEALKHWIP